jgi:hypothetical protein
MWVCVESVDFVGVGPSCWWRLGILHESSDSGSDSLLFWGWGRSWSVPISSPVSRHRIGDSLACLWAVSGLSSALASERHES